MSRANESAHPIQASDLSGSLEPQHGLTIREHFAAMAMQGILGNAALDRVRNTSIDNDQVFLAKAAVRAADALIAELAKPVQS